MNLNQIRAAIRRAKLELIQGKRRLASDNGIISATDYVVKTIRNNAHFSAQNRTRLEILCLPAQPTPESSKHLPTTDKTAKDSLGPDPAPLPPIMDSAKQALGEPVIPISNLPADRPLPDDIPDEYQFEIYRLRRQITALDNDNRRLNDKITKAMEALHDEVRFWRLGIYEGQWETLGQIQRRLKHLEAIARALESPGPIGITQPAVKVRKR